MSTQLIASSSDLKAGHFRAQGEFIGIIMNHWAPLLPATVKMWLMSQQKELFAKARREDAQVRVST